MRDEIRGGMMERGMTGRGMTGRGMMGNGTTRCLKVDGLRKELCQLDGDLIVRFRDGDATYPGVHVMHEEGTDHVDIGSPYPARERLAEVDRKVRKVDGRRPPPKPKVWVLVRRYEWEDQSQQTEYCDTFVFAKLADACSKAKSILRADLRKYGDGVTSNFRTESESLIVDLTANEFPRHLVQLTDSDNAVYELYRRSIG